jgi:GTP-binding protein LepA
MSFTYNIKHIRNFSIIAHIDHGKSTLADRFLEITGTVAKREMQEQLLDDMALERERGITIKSHPVRMYYQAQDGIIYQINLIDTPGHVDFNYEVSRSLSACEGALLVVDAGQGLQAQSLANVHLAEQRKLTILPVINKIDLPTADVPAILEQLEEILAFPRDEVLTCSAKTGIGIKEILEQVIAVIPAPKSLECKTLQALIFDSQYDLYRGVLVYIRVISGSIKKGDTIKFMFSEMCYEVLEVGVFTPKQMPIDALLPGEVGYFSANIKNTKHVKIGDTVTSAKNGIDKALPGFMEMKPVVFSGIYPIDSNDFESLRDALNKFQLNDPALHVEQESSNALGFGFRCGFLGLLHLEIVFERLQREFNLDIITTTPSVIYKIILHDGKTQEIDNPAFYPDPSHISWIEEPWVTCHFITPHDYLGAVMGLTLERRGTCIKTETLDSKRLLLTYELPLNEIITDFADKLKSITRGYASYDYEFLDYREADIVKLEIRVNEEPVDAFSCLIHRSKAENRGRSLCEKLKEVIPMQLFRVPVQAAIGGKVIARETIRALTKNVTAKCYGGDITRKKKLWEKQKEGKKKMKEIGKVTIPQNAFMEVLKLSD